MRERRQHMAVAEGAIPKSGQMQTWKKKLGCSPAPAFGKHCSTQYFSAYICLGFLMRLAPISYGVKLWPAILMFQFHFPLLFNLPFGPLQRLQSSMILMSRRGWMHTVATSWVPQHWALDEIFKTDFPLVEGLVKFLCAFCFVFLSWLSGSKRYLKEMLVCFSDFQTVGIKSPEYKTAFRHQFHPLSFLFELC